MNTETINLIGQAIDGTITEKEFDRLQQLLRNDPKALAHYCQQSEIHGRLTWELSGAPADALGIRKKSILRPVLVPVAAALTVGLFTYAIMRPTPVAEEESIASIADALGTKSNVARVTNSLDAVWEDGSHPVGSWIQPDTLTLVSGKAEVTFDSGARILLEGPATLETHSAHHAKLLAGNGVVHIPDSASGFYMETPANTFNNPNCSFALAVDQGTTEVHVLEGSLDTSPKNSTDAATVLAANQSLRFDSNEALPMQSLMIDVSLLKKELPQLTEGKAAEFVHWSFDSFDGETFPETGTHPHNRFPAVANKIKEGKGTYGIQSVKGKFGRAIRLFGDGSYLQTQFPGISGAKERTVACWVRVPKNNQDKHAYSIVSWGTPRGETGKKWQISWNASPFGTRGALRTEFGGGHVSGSQPICDSKWHHVVSVYRPNGTDDVSSQILHYIDGKLDIASHTRDKAIDTQLEQNDSHLAYIGRRLEENSNFSSFQGSIDEMYVFPAALTPQQIGRLYRDNQTPSNFITPLAAR